MSEPNRKKPALTFSAAPSATPSTSPATPPSSAVPDLDQRPQTQPHKQPGGHFRGSPAAVLTVVLFSYLLIILDVSIVITGLPEIQHDLGLSGASLSWVQNSYTLTFGSLLLLGARSGDLFGRRRMLMIGLIVFALSSLMIGLATSPAILLAGRAIQGMGSAILAPATLALLSANFAEGPARIRALAWYAAMAGIGSSLGLVLGGVFAGLLSWRVGFLVNVPLAGVLVLASGFLLRETPRHHGSLDLYGAMASVAGIAGVTFGIVYAADHGWHQIYSIASLLVGVMFLLLFVRLEAGHKHPLMPLRVFSNRVRNGAYLTRMLFLGSMVSFFYFTTRYLQQVLNMTPVEAGFAFLPFTVLTFLASTQVPRLTASLGNGRLAVAATVLLTFGLGWLAWLSTDSATYQHGIAWAMGLIGVGNGAVLGPLTVAGVSGTTEEDAGAAAGVVNAAHQIGGTLGLSLTVNIAAQAASNVAPQAAAGATALLNGTALSAMLTQGLFATCVLSLLSCASALLIVDRKPA